MEVHTLNVNKEEPWNSMGMTHNIQVHSNYTRHKLYLFLVFIVLFMRILIYISTDWIFATAVNTPLFNSVWVYTFFPICSVSSLQFHFVLLWLFSPFLWQQSSTFTCANAISMKKCFCMKRIKNFVMIFINSKHTMRSVIHGTEVVLHTSFFKMLS